MERCRGMIFSIQGKSIRFNLDYTASFKGLDMRKHQEKHKPHDMISMIYPAAMADDDNSTTGKNDPILKQFDTPEKLLHNYQQLISAKKLSRLGKFSNKKDR